MYKYASNLRTQPAGNASQIFQPRTGQGIIIGPLANKIMPMLLDPEAASRLDVGPALFLQCLSQELVARGILVPSSIESLTTYLNQLSPLKESTHSFFNAQKVKISQLPQDDHVAMLGVPSDLGATKPGTRFGPELLREVSANKTFRGGLFSLKSHKELCRSKVYDIGDLVLEREGLDTWLDILGTVIARLPDSSTPFMVGGDHTFTLPVVQNLFKKRNGKPFTIVQLDSHLDLQVWGSFNEDKPAALEAPIHSNFLSHVIESCPGVKVLQIGPNHYQSVDPSYAANIGKYLDYVGTQISDLEAAMMASVELYEKLPKDQDVYLTFDVDVLCSASLSHTGYPNPLGLSPALVAGIISYLGQNNRLIGADVMEFGRSNQRDIQRSEAELITTIMALILDCFTHRGPK